MSRCSHSAQNQPCNEDGTVIVRSVAEDLTVLLDWLSRVPRPWRATVGRRCAVQFRDMMVQIACGDKSLGRLVRFLPPAIVVGVDRDLLLQMCHHLGKNRVQGSLGLAISLECQSACQSKRAPMVCWIRAWLAMGASKHCGLSIQNPIAALAGLSSCVSPSGVEYDGRIPSIQLVAQMLLDNGFSGFSAAAHIIFRRSAGRHAVISNLCSNRRPCIECALQMASEWFSSSTRPRRKHLCTACMNRFNKSRA